MRLLIWVAYYKFSKGLIFTIWVQINPLEPIAFEIFQKVIHNWGRWPYPGLVLKLWCIQAYMLVDT